MPRSASGVYTLPAGNPVVPGTTIDSAWANTTMDDLGTEITNSLSRTGAGGMLVPFRIADGLVTGPGLSFLNETNTGLYRSGAGSAWMAVLGVNVAQFSTVGLNIASGKSLTAQGPTYLISTLAVTGATTMASTLVVTGAITATGGVVGNVTGNVTSAGTSNFYDVVITGSLDMTVGSAATITGLSTPVNASDAANKGYVDTQDALRLALTGGTMSGAIAMGTSKITGLGTPTADQDAATKIYVDSVAQGLDVKASCRAATIANITLSGAQTIDGVVIIAGDRVLVKDQTTAANNGIYLCASGAWTRTTDADTWIELTGAFTFIEDGTVNDNTGWVCTIAPGGTLGSTAVTFEQFSGAGQVIAGAGLTKTGNTLNVGTASSSRIVVNPDDIDLATTGVAASTYQSVTVDTYGRITGGTNPTTLAGYNISDAYTQTQINNALALKLNLSGGTMSGAIAMGASKITGMADPTVAQDAATKNYIDTIFGSTVTAAASAATATTQAGIATTQAGIATTQAGIATTQATNAATTYTNFNNQYLGSYATNPTVNNTGGPLVTGNLYWNSTASEMRVYSGSAWVAAYLPAAGYLALTGGTMTGAITFAAGQTWPTFNQNTTGTAAGLSATLAIASGGTGTATPSLVQGTNVTITGTWPNQTIAASGGVATATTVSDTANTSTGYFQLPQGTTAQRPASPALAMMRANTTTNQLELYANGAWNSLTSFANKTPSIEYLVVGGGAGGGGNIGGGGGAGGFRTASGFSVASGSSITVTVGAGGSGGTGGAQGNVGSDSVFSTITSTGGGGGGYAAGTPKDGTAGGSGGGAGSLIDSSSNDAYGGAGNTPSTSPSQGNRGGNVTNSVQGAGGGGGASAAGGDTSTNTSGAGGAGTASSISGSSVTYAGGGGGGGYPYNGAAGGAGGGGKGGDPTNGAGTAGTANTGGGGGAGAGGMAPGGNGAAGGSGVVIIRYADTYDAAASTTGSPTITVSGGYRVYQWTSSGSITF